MNLHTVEAVVRRLFADEEFRSRAIANPSVALSEYRLMAEEQKALTTLCTQMAGGLKLPDSVGAETRRTWL